MLCYKSHNRGACQEDFAKSQVESQLKADKVRDPKEIRRMQEVLRKVKMEGEDVEEGAGKGEFV